MAAHAAAASGGPPGGDGGSGGDGGGDDGKGDGKGDGEGEDEDDTTVLNFKQVEEWMADKKFKLPSDIWETAKTHGVRLSYLKAFAIAQALPISGFLIRLSPFLRDRILADNLLLFKMGAEIAIDTTCTTVAELRVRGDSFMDELEYYFSDLMVGLVCDVVLVSLMASTAVMAGPGAASGASALGRWLASVPGSVFAANIPGVKTFTMGQRLSCLLVKFCEYSLAGLFCGLVGQYITNKAIEAHRAKNPDDEHANMIPPLGKTALVWGAFMGISSNLRYQAVFGLERLVAETIAKQVPQVAYFATMALRFGNNVIGGEQFIVAARMAGIQ